MKIKTIEISVPKRDGLMAALCRAAATPLLGLVLLAPVAAQADLPAVAVSPRNNVLASLTALTNGATTTLNASTNLLLTAAYQHNLAVFTSVVATNTGVGTNAIGSGSASAATSSFTNYFDLGKVVGGLTNWTTGQPIKVTGTLSGLGGLNQADIVAPTSFDGFELIRLTKIGSSCTNTFYFTVTLGQTP